MKAAASVSFFGEGGLLARVLPDYEERPAQRRFSEAVGGVLREGGLLLAEAGTGTGKTLAYLLPAVELGRRVVVSTGTKNLQEQLVDKDLPLLARALGPHDRHRRPRGGGRPARLGGLLARDLRRQRELHRPVLSRFRPLLGDADAAARPGGRPRGGEPPSALRGPRGEGRQLRARHSPLRHRDPRRGAPPRRRGHPVLRSAGLVAPRGGAGAGRRAGAESGEARRPRGACG